MYVYLDHNIYIEALENKKLKNLLVKPKEKLQCLYSPAHMEEIYRVDTDKTSKCHSKMKKLKRLVSAVSSDLEVLPSNTVLQIKKEPPAICYLRVKREDTRERVVNDSLAKLNRDRKHYKSLVEKNKHYSSIPNIEPEKIWDNELVKEIIDNWNDNIKKLIEQYNTSKDVVALSLRGIDKTLPDDFCFQKGNYNKLQKKHNQLEYTIEMLFNLLNYIGYNYEKEQRKAISGTHDISHAIYATKADILLTMDYRFAQKCKAVYSFLGAKTTVIYCKQQDIIDVWNDLIEDAKA